MQRDAERLPSCYIHLMLGYLQSPRLPRSVTASPTLFQASDNAEATSTESPNSAALVAPSFGSKGMKACWSTGQIVWSWVGTLPSTKKSRTCASFSRQRVTPAQDVRRS